MLFASLSVYAVSQKFDVWLYHAWWKLTERKSGSSRRFLWLRNNAATLISQVLNTVIFTLVAFAGWYDPAGALLSREAAWLDVYGTSRVLTARFS